ncbi:obscurin-like protein 1 [Dryobates pubescens]|uniref:obscurin-like protein 1 n=1 Tax=Dryobates pubescens TaxID=118200 RepID=UPI0023B8B275|nr:obscurin-like protein 1 [Dryobates pubescens]
MMEGFGGAPRFLAYPRAITVQSGSDAVLSCQITGDPPPSILWEKDKTPVEPSSRFHVEAKGNLYSLLVSCTIPQDSGIYVCKAKNCVGETYAAATLKVESGKSQEQNGCSGTEAPAFLVAPSSMRVCCGEDVMFTCRVSGQPCLVLEWEKDGHRLSDIFESSHFAVGQEPEDWHFLKLFGARPPDRGVYICRARSGSQEALAAAVLLVEPRVPLSGLPNGSPGDGANPPVERQQRWQQHAAGQHARPETWVPNGTVLARVPKAKAFAVSMGKHAKFRCYVTGKPKPEIIWQKDGEALTPGRRHLIYEDREGYFILKVLYCKPQDQGLYVCTASNTAGQTLSAVQLQVKEHRLRFQVQLADVEVAEREDAVLECQVPLETIPTVWYLEDRELQPSHKYVMEERGVVRRLTIRDARTDDDGIYLCQMKDKGRSIAEVSVRGVIAKRLPRKLDVMEGENAVFCVETREVVEGTCWSRDGLQLRESPQTVLKSFGRMHLLVLVHVTRQDAGIISFTVGESQTSSQLRVKCVKRDPPGTPVAAEMSVVESNVALLSWCPAPDAHLRPPRRYLIERREVAEGEWVQCLSTDLPGCVRVLGASVPHEADYFFRVCATNEHGRSSPVEFPGSVHLAPTARLEKGLQDTWVQDGEDVQLELSAVVQGTWFLNGMRLGEEVGGRCSVRHCGTEHSLLIRRARLADSGAQVTFMSGSVRDSATLHVKAPQVCITPVPEAKRLQEVPAGLPVLLECQVSSPDALVHWLKDGEAVPLDDVIAVEAEGCMRRLLLRSASPSDTGTYTCDTGDDAVSFVVTVTEAPVRIVSSNEEAPHTYTAGQRVELWCQLSRLAAPVHWYKDGEEVEVSESLVLEQEGLRCRLVLPCAQPQDTGAFVCDAGGDSIFYTITVAAPTMVFISWLSPILSLAEAPVRIVSSNEEAPHTYTAGQRVELWCQLSRPAALVHWYKDGEEVEVSESLVLEQEGPWCRLVLPCAKPQDTGEFVCDAGGDSVFYTVTVTGRCNVQQQPFPSSPSVPAPCSCCCPTALKVRIAPVPEALQFQEVLAGLPMLLECQVSPSDASVQWLKDGKPVVPTEVLAICSEGGSRRLHIPAAVPSDSGMYTCDAGDDAASFRVSVSEASVRIVGSNKEAPHTYISGQRVKLWCQLSHPAAQVQWYKDKEEVEVGENLVLEQEGLRCCLVLPCARPQDTGEFVCNAGDASVSYHVVVAEPPVRILHPLQRSLELPVQAPGPVELRCELSVPDAAVRWFKDGLEVDETNNLLLLAEGAWRCLLIPRSSAEDEGEYICETKDEAVSFDVKVSGQWRHESREVLICLLAASSFPAWQRCTWDHVVPILLCVITILFAEPPVRILQPHRPVPVVTVFLGETVMLGCELSCTDAPVHWTKEGIRLEAGGSLVLEEEGAHRRLIIPVAQAEHSGKYICDATDDTVTFTVQVLDPLVRILEKDTLPTHWHCQALEDLTLELHLSHAHGEVKWYKDGEKLQDTGRVRLEEDGTRRSLVILGATGRDTGEYLCDAGDDSIVFFITVEVPRVVEIITELQNLTVLEGEDATFKCLVSPEDVAMTWQLNGQPVVPGERLMVTKNGLCHSLTLRQCQSGDAGTVTANAEGLVSTARLSVQEAQVLFVRKLQDMVAEEQREACLEVEVSHEAAEVQWLKQGILLQPSSKYQLQESGCRRTLTIRCLSPADRGIYRCESLHDRTQARLYVEREYHAGDGDRMEMTGMGRQASACGHGFLAAQKVSIQIPLADVETFEKETATFFLELSHPGVPGVWTRDGIRVKPSSRCRISAKGCGHSLTLEGLTLEDSATITFTTDTLRCSARLVVLEPPITMVKVPQDLGVLETGVASFECELSRPSAEVMWFKDGQELRPGPKCRIYSVGRRRILQLSHCELADAGIYTCDVGGCQASATLHVQERQVCIVQELQDAQLQEGDNAVFTCEVSHGDIKCEWFRDGEKIKVSSKVKTRQEAVVCAPRMRDSSVSQLGQQPPQRLLCGCKVPVWGAGAGWAPAPGLGCSRVKLWDPHGSPAHPMMPMAPLNLPALPIRIVKPLRDKTVLARHKATLECTVSHARGRVRWLRGDTEIFAGDKYEICNLDCYRTLIIHCVGPEDEDSYTCDAFDDRSTARLLVEGKGAPKGASLGADCAIVPHSGRASGALLLTACKGLSTVVSRAGWRWDQESVPTWSGTPRMLQLFHCSHRELEARMQYQSLHTDNGHRCWEMGSCFTWDTLMESSP